MSDLGLPDVLSRTGRRLALARALGNVALAGVGVFALAAVALQIVRADLDWVRAPLSFYLVGPDAAWLQFGYAALACTLASVGIGYWHATVARPGHRAPMLLFLVGAGALMVTAWAETDLGGPLQLSGLIHAISAPLAFMGTTFGMLVLSWRFRVDPYWRRQFPVAFGLAVACFVALLVHVLWRDAPRGLSQKLVIAMILLWLALVALWLRRAGEHKTII